MPFQGAANALRLEAPSWDTSTAEALVPQVAAIVTSVTGTNLALTIGKMNNGIIKLT